MSTTVKLPTFHADQARAYNLLWDRRRGEWDQNRGGRFKVWRAGRRWGKTVGEEIWIADGAIKGYECGWFAPSYKYLNEVYEDFLDLLAPVLRSSNKTDGVIRTTNGGRIDFWSLENDRAGRSRKYRRVVIDEAAFTNANMMDIWKQSIKPTLLDYSGSCLIGSNTNGVDPDNFMYQVCNQPEHGFIEFHAPSINNPTIPERLPDESGAAYALRRAALFADLQAREHPLVFKQEYLAEFVDWSGVAFFALEKLLVSGQPIDPPANCDSVYAIIDSASKTGTANDGTAVTFYARSKYGLVPLVILDWDLAQIEGALLETWLPTIFQRGEELAKQCGARSGFIGAWIEDKASGIVLLQQAGNKGMAARPIDSKLTALGKDERAISVSGYVYTGKVKLSELAYNKTTTFKQSTRNHLVSQVTSFRVGDKAAASRADDLLDTFCYGVALGLGNSEGF